MTYGPTAVVWFRGADLRVADNPQLRAAAARVAAGAAASVLPVFVFDPRFLGPSAWGTPKTGAFRAEFLLASVLGLKEGLRALGSDLAIAVGAPEEVLPPLCLAAAGGAPGAAAGSLVLAQAEAASEERGAERAVRRALAAAGAGRLEVAWGAQTLYHPDDLPFEVALLPEPFTAFRQAVEARSKVRPPAAAPARGALPLPPALRGAAALAFAPATVGDLNAALAARCGGLRLPLAPPPDARAALRFVGGEAAAAARLRYYLWDSDRVASYFDTRNGLLGGDYSTKLSPWLAHGCVSARQVHAELKRYEAARTANKSTYWVAFELVWRDWFRFFAAKHGDRIFAEGGVTGRPGGRPWAADAALFARWRDGRTGWPLVDASMRELAATGFMSNRSRQNVASCLALDLGLDWRLGADWFESLLVDSDVHSNWGNWAAAAGLIGGRTNRFNITKQGKDYDAGGEYVRTWCPELANVPAARVHEPWLMSRQEQEACGCRIGQEWPQPVAASQFAGGGGEPRFGGGGRGGGRGRGGGGRGGGRGRDRQAPPGGRGG